MTRRRSRRGRKLKRLIRETLPLRQQRSVRGVRADRGGTGRLGDEPRRRHPPAAPNAGGQAQEPIAEECAFDPAIFHDMSSRTTYRPRSDIPRTKTAYRIMTDPVLLAVLSLSVVAESDADLEKLPSCSKASLLINI